jgi:hypothetical protein
MIRNLLNAIALLLASVLGLFVVPLAYATRQRDQYRTLFAWWNNPKGIYTTLSHLPYWIKPKGFLDAYYWTAIRNPARGFSLSLGFVADETTRIETIRSGKFESLTMVVVAHHHGRDYKMVYHYYEFLGWTYQGKYGCKLWSYSESKPIPIGKQVSFVFYPQIRKL